MHRNTSLGPYAGGGTSLAELSGFLDIMREQADRAEAKTEAKLEKQRQEAEAEKSEMRAEIDKQRAEMQAAMAPQEVISSSQIEALETRLEALHRAKLISDDDLNSLEDCIADYFEAKAAIGVVTAEVASAISAVGKLRKMIVLSEGVSKDGTFARQARRKFV